MKVQLRDKDDNLLAEWYVDAEGVEEWIGDAVVDAILSERPPH
jgi:hypothetical protein